MPNCINYTENSNTGRILYFYMCINNVKHIMTNNDITFTIPFASRLDNNHNMSEDYTGLVND